MKDWNIKEDKAQNAIYLKEDNGGKGRFFRARFLQPGLVKYSFGVCLLKKEIIDKFVYNFVGCPVVIDHKDVTDESAKDLRVGVISKVEFDQFDAWYWCEGVIFDQEAIDLVNNGYNVSCQYEITQYATNDRKELHNGNPYDKEILDGAPEHLAIVKNPRYENAMIAVNAIDLTASNDKWITVHPNGEDEEGRPLLIKEGEDVKDAMKRQWGAGDDQLTLDLPGAKEAKKDARTHENKKQAAKEKLFNAWSSHLWESDTKQASKKTMEALEEYNKYHEEKIDMDGLDDFVERYEQEKDNEKNKAQVDEYNKKNKDKEDAKKNATKLKDNESKEDFVKRILSTEITKYKPTTDVIDWGKQKQQGKRSGGMVMGSMGDISLQGKKEYKNILGGLPEYQEIKDEFNGGGVETPMMQMAYLKAREAGFNKEQSMLFAYSITDKNNLLYDKLKEGNKNKASNSFIEQFKDTLYTVLAEGITSRLGELIAQNKNSTEKWITIKGNHILLKDGESIADAFKRTTGASLSKGNKYEQKDTYKTNEAYKKILDNVKKSNEADLTPDEVIINALNKLGIDKQKLLNKINEADMYNAGVYETHKRYSDGNGVYKRERAEYHKEIIKELFKNAKNAKPKNGEKPTFMFLGGRGGSGKSKFDGLVYDKNNYIVLDADAIKELLPEYKGYNAFEVHEESSDILKQALRKAQKEGLNVVLDATMKSLPSSEKHLKSFVDAGYNIEMYYMHLPRAKAAERAIGRFMGKNGRYVPLEVLLSMKDNEQNFDKLKKYASKWAFYNNDVASKEDDPILVDKNY